MLQSRNAGLKVHKPWRVGAGIIERMIICRCFLSVHLRLGPYALRHVRSGAAPRFKIAFGKQLIIGFNDCAAGHMQIFARQGLLPKYGVPDRYEIVDHIAKTGIGKINKKWLREQYRS